MISRNFLVIIWAAFLSCLSLTVQGSEPASPQESTEPPTLQLTPDELRIKRSDFPKDFAFGVSTSASQIEGATTHGGRGPSVWDYYVKKHPDNVIDKSNMDTAIDSFRRYKEDVQHVKDLGVGVYRFSISWTRILPNGSLKGGVKREGIDHYNSLIDELVKNGIKPLVTLLHFDEPQALQDKYFGLLNRSFADDFKDYSEICFKTFGDRVKHWITINEPLITAKYGYAMDLAPPCRCSNGAICPDGGNSAVEPYLVSHHLLLAHAAAARLYKDKFQPKQGGEIGLSLAGQYYEPYSNSSDNVAAAKRVIDFELGWYMEPLVYGHYPESMRRLVKDRLPNFTKEEIKMLKGSFDFIGINYYTGRYAKSIPIKPHVPPTSYDADQFVNVTAEKDGVPIGPKAEGNSNQYIYPEGLLKLLEFIKTNYRSPKLYITENGISENRNDTRSLDVILKDQHRINFVRKHLHKVLEAIKNGANVKGYCYWSAFDSFEWNQGYTVRFGLYYIDYNDKLKRIPKESAKWYHAFLQNSWV